MLNRRIESMLSRRSSALVETYRIRSRMETDLRHTFHASAAWGFAPFSELRIRAETSYLKGLLSPAQLYINFVSPNCGMIQASRKFFRLGSQVGWRTTAIAMLSPEPTTTYIAGYVQVPWVISRIMYSVLRCL